MRRIDVGRILLVAACNSTVVADGSGESSSSDGDTGDTMPPTTSTSATTTTATTTTATTTTATTMVDDTTTEATSSGSIDTSEVGSETTNTDDSSANGLPTGVDDEYLVPMDTELAVVAAQGLLANDADPDDDALTVVVDSFSTANGAMVDLQADGSFSYVPADTWWGEDSFTYAIDDGEGGQSDADVRIVVAPTLAPLSAVADGVGGFVIECESQSDSTGTAVAIAGDINGDGLADLLVGGPSGFSDADGIGPGRAYVAFGKSDTDPVQLTSVAAGMGGFFIGGLNQLEYVGDAVSAAGDFNGDGRDDLVVGVPGSDWVGNNAGRAYIVFGKDDTETVTYADLAAGIGGFVIDGQGADDRAGESVAGAGDVNDDGLADVIIGAPGWEFGLGRAYVVFGKVENDPISLTDVVGGEGGFALFGQLGGDSFGESVNAAGDIDADGVDDVLVGAPRFDGNGSDSGRSYVVFGKLDTDAVLAADIVQGMGGFIINGPDPYDESGSDVASAGDFDGDGFGDVVIGARAASMNGTGSGSAYVVLGKADTAAVQLTQVANGNGGFIIEGGSSYDRLGNATSRAGDLDGDGLGDIIIGANGFGTFSNGRSYVVFGKADTDEVFVDDLAMGIGGFALDAEAENDAAGLSVGGGGDVNGDGFPDVIVGAPGSDANFFGGGRSYVVFGGDFTLSSR